MELEVTKQRKRRVSPFEKLAAPPPSHMTYEELQESLLVFVATPEESARGEALYQSWLAQRKDSEMEFQVSSGGGCPLPPGQYPVTFAGVEDFIAEAGSQGSQYGPAVKVCFTVSAGQFAGQTVDRLCSKSLSPQSNLGKFATQISGQPLQVGTTFSFQTFVGTPGSILVQLDNGKSKIGSFIRGPQQQQMQQPSPQMQQAPPQQQAHVQPQQAVPQQPVAQPQVAPQAMPQQPQAMPQQAVPQQTQVAPQQPMQGNGQVVAPQTSEAIQQPPVAAPNVPFPAE